MRGLLTEARDHADRVSPGARPRRRPSRALERPTYRLPRLADGIDADAIRELAELLTEQGMA